MDAKTTRRRRGGREGERRGSKAKYVESKIREVRDKRFSQVGESESERGNETRGKRGREGSRGREGVGSLRYR